MVNSASFTLNGLSIPARWALLTVHFESKEYQGSTYYELHYNFQIKRGEWRTKTPQYGFYQIVAGERKEILDANGKPVKKPWPLNSDGTKKTNPDDAPYILEEMIFPEYSFASFGFE